MRALSDPNFDRAQRFLADLADEAGLGASYRPGSGYWPGGGRGGWATIGTWDVELEFVAYGPSGQRAEVRIEPSSVPKPLRRSFPELGALLALPVDGWRTARGAARARSLGEGGAYLRELWSSPSAVKERALGGLSVPQGPFDETPDPLAFYVAAFLPEQPVEGAPDWLLALVERVASDPSLRWGEARIPQPATESEVAATVYGAAVCLLPDVLEPAQVVRASRVPISDIRAGLRAPEQASFTVDLGSGTTLRADLVAPPDALAPLEVRLSVTRARIDLTLLPGRVAPTAAMQLPTGGGADPAAAVQRLLTRTGFIRVAREQLLRPPAELRRLAPDRPHWNWAALLALVTSSGPRELDQAHLDRLVFDLLVDRKDDLDAAASNEIMSAMYGIATISGLSARQPDDAVSG